MSRSGWVLVALGTVGCQGTGGLGGDEIGYIDDAPFGEAWEDQGSVPVARAVPSVECVEADHGIDSALSAEGSAGAVLVTHRGLDTHCDADWDVQYEVDGGAFTIAVNYVDVAAAVNTECSCAYTLSYTVPVSVAGTYTVTAGGDSATVVVPE